MAECFKTIEYPDRKAIAALYAAGAKAGQIAKEIGVSPRSIYAELKRGQDGDKLDKNFSSRREPVGENVQGVRSRGEVDPKTDRQLLFEVCRQVWPDL